MKRSSVAQLLTVTTRWAESRADVFGLALVGSHACGAAREQSDLDLLLLVSDPVSFRADIVWLHEIQWQSLRVEVAAWRDVTYGAVWSRHVALSDGSEVEFSFAAPSWANTSPVDPGTRRVINDGWRILVDRNGLLLSVATHAAILVPQLPPRRRRFARFAVRGA